MIDPLGKKAARQSMGQAVHERDIERLMKTARAPGGTVIAPRPSQNEFAARLDLHRNVRSATTAEALPVDDTEEEEELPHPYVRAQSQPFTIWDIPVFLLYACLGVFTRIWTDVTLYFDFGVDTGFRAFAVAVSIALHLFIFAIIGNAWRAKWEVRSRNFLALAVLIGYLGFRTLSQI